MTATLPPRPRPQRGFAQDEGEYDPRPAAAYDRPRWERFKASLLITAPAAPIIATIVGALRVIVFSSGEGAAFDVPGFLLGGAVFLLGVWLLLAGVHLFLGWSRAERANATSYQLLANRQADLHTMAQEYAPTTAEVGDERWCQRVHIARENLRAHLAALDEGLTGEGTQWVLGSGYIALWRQVHRAETEALYLAPPEEVAAAAEQVGRRLTGAKMPAKDIEAMQRHLEEAKKVLLGKASAKSMEHHAVADIQQIVWAVHQFRDNAWNELANARNHLLLAMGLSGLVMYPLLGLALIAGVSREVIAGAAAVYLVGAIAGLFSQLYRRSRTGTLHDDYGLATTRLIVGPQLSGLAAVLGVVLIGVVTAGAAQPFTLEDAFASWQGTSLIGALVFGLTPGLLIDLIKEQGTEIAKLKSTETAQPDEGEAASA